MKAKVADLRKLIQMLFDKSGESINQQGFENVTELFKGNIKDGYIYKKIYNPSQKAGENKTIGLRDEYLNMISSYVGFKNYKMLVESLYKKEDAQLESCI